jgi:EAL domain-containing protein (putative c-di-GMP-specific phosphodiesterase class I)
MVGGPATTALRRTRIAVWVMVPVAVIDVLDLARITSGAALPGWVATVRTFGALALLPVLLSAITSWRPLTQEVALEERELTERRRMDAADRASTAAKRADVERALVDDGAFRMAFQPLVALSNRWIVGYEALARFVDGRVPNLWFEDAHSVGLGVELEMRALARSLGCAAHRRGYYIAVNLSPATLTSGTLANWLANAEVENANIVLELTEHAVVSDYDAMREAFDRIHRRGLRIAIDDVGSGFATLRHVVDLRPDIIKLDRSLVSYLDEDPARYSLTASLVQFASATGCAVVAEGIERPEELEVCRTIGVQFGQGFLFGRPGELPSTFPPARSPAVRQSGVIPGGHAR